jgi:hypothetical protein
MDAEVLGEREAGDGLVDPVGVRPAALKHGPPLDGRPELVIAVREHYGVWRGEASAAVGAGGERDDPHAGDAGDLREAFDAVEVDVAGEPVGGAVRDHHVARVAPLDEPAVRGVGAARAGEQRQDESRGDGDQDDKSRERPRSTADVRPQY